MRYAVVAFVLLAALTSCEKAPVTILEQAEVDFRAGNWSHVIAACDQHLQGDPENLSAISLRGRAYLATEQYERAIEDFTMLIELSPEDCDPLYRRGMAYEGLGKSELAVADKLKARALDPFRKSAYAYETSNFIDKPALGGGAPLGADDEETTDNVTEETSEADEAMLAENAESERADLDRELDQDYYDRETKAEQEAAISGGGAPLADTLPSSARRHLRYGDLDQDFVRGAVKGYRDMLEDERTTTTTPRLTRSTPSAAGISLDDLLGPEPQSKRDQEQDQEGSDELGRLKPPVSTALPPGYIGPRPTAGMRSTTDYGGMRTPRASSPFANSGPLQAPGASALNPGIPGGSGTTPGPYSLHANPIHGPGQKPTLSTSLPTAAGATGVPGVPGTLPQTGGPLNASRRLPAMLPPAGVQPDRP